MFKILNEITAGKYSFTLGALTQLAHFFPRKEVTLVYADGKQLGPYDGSTDFKDLVKFDNQNPGFRMATPIAARVGDMEIPIVYDAAVKTPYQAGKVSNKYGVFANECWDLGKIRINCSKKDGANDVARTFLNFVLINDIDKGFVLHGPYLPSSGLTSVFGDLVFVGGAALPDQGGEISDPSNNDLTFMCDDGAKFPAKMYQSFKHKSVPLSAFTLAGAICHVAIADGQDYGLIQQIKLPIFVNNVVPLEEKDGVWVNEDLEKLYETVKKDVSGDAIVTKLHLMTVDMDAGVQELALKIDGKRYDMYSEGGLAANQSCSLFAAAECFYRNTKFSKDLSVISGVYFSYLGICSTPGYTITETLANGRMITYLDASVMTNGKQDDNKVYFSGDMDPETSLFYRVYRAKPFVGSYVIAKIESHTPGYSHYVCVLYTGDKQLQVVADSVGGDNDRTGEFVTPLEAYNKTTFSGIRATYDGDYFAEVTGRSNRADQSKIAFRLGGVGGMNV